MSPVQLFKDTLAEWGRHKATMLSAALSYYTIFSLAPLLIIIIAVVGLIVGNSSAHDQIMSQISSQLGGDVAQLLQTMVSSNTKGNQGIIATVIGLIMLLAGAAGVFIQLKGALNIIWDVPEKPASGIQGILKSIRDEFLSFAMVLGIGLLLLVSIVVSTVLSGAAQVLGNQLQFPAGFWELVNTVISLLVLIPLFAAIYKVLPDENPDWRDTLVGATVTATLFTIGKFLIGLYLGHASPASAYGAAGSLVVVLLWIYYSAQILYLGAEFTHVYALKRAGKPIPSAVKAAADAKQAEVTAAAKKAEAAPKTPTPAPQNATHRRLETLHTSGRLVLLGMALFEQVQRLRHLSSGQSSQPRKSRSGNTAQGR